MDDYEDYLEALRRDAEAIKALNARVNRFCWWLARAQGVVGVLAIMLAVWPPHVRPWLDVTLFLVGVCNLVSAIVPVFNER